MKILIIGGGIAGGEVASCLAGKKGLEITMVSAEPHREYDPCGLPYYVGGLLSREAIYRKPPSFYEEAGIKLVLDCPIAAIDSRRRLAVARNGAEFPYDRLVLAHGGSLFLPPIAGLDKSGVFSCKSLAEADKLARHPGRRAVVIGSGAIGIEVAEALKIRGGLVSVIEVLPWVLPVLFDEPAGRLLEQALRDYGIEVFCGEKVLAVNGGAQVASVTTDKREIPCDTVVLATGVVPGRKLAETAGIKVGRGILVDDRMATNVADIYACGDCVETPDACTGDYGLYQLKHNALDQARIVAGNILGQDCRYPGAYVFARAHFFDTHAASFGKTRRSLSCDPRDLRILEKTSGRDYLRVILQDETIVGGQGIGRYAALTGPLMAAMWRRERFPSQTAEPAGTKKDLPRFPWLQAQMPSLSDLFDRQTSASS